MTQVADERSVDFFISYTSADESWASWVAWILEEANYTTYLQAWDIVSGTHFVAEMHGVTQSASKTIAILSESYINSAYAAAEWQEAWRTDPQGAEGKLLVFRTEACQRPGLLGQIVSDDLFGVSPETARSRVLVAARRGRRKPSVPPGFPGKEGPQAAVPFPGRLVPAELQAVYAACGPMTPDNPCATAIAFWNLVLAENYDDLDLVVTPESRGHWPLGELKNRTQAGGLTTGVMKPCYDVAYVRLIPELDAGVPQSPLVVAGGLMPTDALVITLVLRPELGSWRVHGVGQPYDPGDLPRTWTADDMPRT